MTLTPAYGRDYRTKRDALSDFAAGKDFILADYSSPWDGKPVSRQDLPAGSTVNLRFDKLRKVAVAKV
jgi:hypothetical protein